MTLEAKRVEKLQKLTKKLTSDHALNQWQILAELRYDELKRGL